MERKGGGNGAFVRNDWKSGARLGGARNFLPNRSVTADLLRDDRVVL